jgi:hypothetical protein
MRKPVIYIVSIIICLAVLGWLYSFSTTGKVIIKTNDSNATIKLLEVGKTKPLKQASGQLSASLHSGQYIASVEGNSLGASQLVIIKAHQTAKYTLNPIQPSGVEPVTIAGGNFLAAGGQNLFYLDSTNDYLYRVDSQNNLSLADPNHQFISVKWADSSFGIGQAVNGSFYTITPGATSLLKLPVARVGSYSISPDKQIYFTSGKDIYRASAGGDFSKIYTSKDDFSAISASNNMLAIINAPDADKEQSAPGYVLVLGSSGSTVRKDIESSEALAWSPSGKYMAVAFGPNPAIYDNSLNKVAPLPGTGVSNPVWLDDNSLFYSQNDQLWQYDRLTQKSNLVANMPLGAIILAASLNPDKAYIYLSASGTNGTTSIKRVGLKGQAVPKFIFQLQSILPKNINNCALGMINFTGVTVTVSPGSPGCQQAAATELQQDGFDLSQLSITPASL